MNSDKYNVLVICFVLVLSSCAMDGSTDNPQITNPEIYKGKEGLDISVISSLPEKVFESEPIEYVVKVTNKGVYNIDNGVLNLHVEKGYLNIGGSNTKKEKINLEGKEIFRTLDDFDIIQFNINTGRLDDTSQSHDALILVTSCYDYLSKAFADVCIDSDPHDIKPVEKECKTKNIDLNEGQGGPVMISKIETRMLIDDNSLRPQFKIHIQNVGGGSVIEPGKKEIVCSSNEIPKDQYNKIILTKISFSDFNKNDFVCAPEPLKLRGNKDIITCTLKPGKISKEISNYRTPLSIELSYGYSISHSNIVKIEKIKTV